MNRNAHCEMRKCVKLVIDDTWLWRVCNINFISCIRFINFSIKATSTNCVKFVCIRIFDLFGQKKEKKTRFSEGYPFSPRGWMQDLWIGLSQFFETWNLLQFFRFAGCSCQLLYHVVALISIPYCWIQCIAANSFFPNIRRNFLLCVQSQSKIYALINVSPTRTLSKISFFSLLFRNAIVIEHPIHFWLIVNIKYWRWCTTFCA